jgi:hypothetical protein
MAYCLDGNRDLDFVTDGGVRADKIGPGDPEIASIDMSTRIERNSLMTIRIQCYPTVLTSEHYMSGVPLDRQSPSERDRAVGCHDPGALKRELREAVNREEPAGPQVGVPVGVTRREAGRVCAVTFTVPWVQSWSVVTMMPYQSTNVPCTRPTRWRTRKLICECTGSTTHLVPVAVGWFDGRPATVCASAHATPTTRAVSTRDVRRLTRGVMCASSSNPAASRNGPGYPGPSQTGPGETYLTRILLGTAAATLGSFTVRIPS